MKQIIILGNLNHWKQEADCVADIFHLTANRVITVNIGPGTLKTDLDLRDLQRMFSGKTDGESVTAAMKKLYSQGIADGVICFLGKEPQFFGVIDSALAALPFGLPKVAITSGDCSWQSNWDVLRFNLPGRGNKLNPALKICLSNAAFALSGMVLNNIQNFGSSKPTIALCCGEIAGKSMAALGINFLSISKEDYLSALINHGYIDGLLLSRECQNIKTLVEVATHKGIPVVLVCQNPASVQASLNPPSFSPSPVLIVYPCRPISSPASIPEIPPTWPPHKTIPYKYGTRPFYWHAAEALVQLMD